jgi:hypothetical protein
VAAINVDDCFSADYVQYKVVFNITGTTASAFNIRLRVGGADNSSTNYRRQRFTADSSTLTGARNVNETSWDAAGNFGNGISYITILEILNPFQTQNTSAYNVRPAVLEGNPLITFNAFGINVTTSYTGFSVISASGNITGTIDVFGYKLGS